MPNTLELPNTALSVVLERAAKREQARRKNITAPVISAEERFVGREQLAKEITGALIKGEFAVALKQVSAAAKRYEESDDHEGQALTLYLLGTCYRRLNDLPTALEKLQESYERYQILNDAVRSANSLLAKSGVLRILGRDEEAIQDIKQCREIYRQAGEKVQEMRALMNLAILYKQAGNVAMAQEHLYECLPVFEVNKLTIDVAKVLLNIASNYMVLKNPQETIRFAERGIPLFEAAGDLHNVAMARSVLGAAYLALEDYEVALEQFRTALAIAEKIGVRWIIAILLGDMGEALLSLNRFEEAREILDRCQQMNGVDENRLVYCGTLEQLGRLYSDPAYKGRDAEKALRCLTEARQLSEEQGANMLLTKIHQALAKLYEQKGDFQQALESFRSFHNVQQQIFNEDSDRRIKELHTRFEVEKAQKDAEIAHLRSVELAAALESAERLRALADAHARTDTLTGVENRRALDERLVQEFARARRNKRPLTIALLDIDHFKKINDIFGHAIGDGALKHLTAVLRSQFRTGDYIARYGGEEFALLFPETGLSEAIEICERLRIWVAASAWSQVHPSMHQVTMSVGVCAFTGDSTAIQTVFEIADQNLYKAKQGGRNQVVG